MRIVKSLSFITLLFLSARAYGQASSSFSVVVINEKAQPVDGATIKLLKNAQTLKTVGSNTKGMALFENLQPGAYYFLVSHTGYQPQTSKVYRFPSALKYDTIRLQPQNTMLQEVSVVTRNPPVQRKEGKVVLDMEASVTNTGLSVLEVLEKSPGVIVDKNGGISLQGKTGVMVMVDDKPTYLSGSDLNDMLSSMSSAQVAQIELITNPTARYDASGNAGIINIKTKKNKQVGFNGSFTTADGQGVYPKSNNSLVLNYRVGKVNTFFNYSLGYIKYLTDIYAYRKYFNSSNTVTSILDQPSYFAGSLFNNTIKTGLDYYISPKTTIGIALTGTSNTKDGNNTATATWLNTGGGVDSAIATTNKNDNAFKNGVVNLNLRHTLSATQDIAADVDLLRYTIGANQDYNNHLLAPGGYSQLSRSEIPTTINITSGKFDYTLKAKNSTTWQMGVKASHSSTDNSADYQNYSGGNWVVDNTRSNHFIYSENVSAVYALLDKKKGKWSGQFGLRYEYTNYHAHQLGNALQKDSAFSRKYGSFFPSGYLSYQADTANNFTLTVSRRIDRPAFQKLNPFYQIINKYTYMTGNAYILPQYSLNFELSHQYKNWLTTTLSYADISDYFSQIFLEDATKGILLYTQGNVGHAYNLGLSGMVIASPARWWSLTGQAVYNHKQMKGFNGNTYTTTIDQLNLNLNNQLTLSKTYTAEVSGAYTTKMRVDLQELVYPSGQVSLGISRPVMQKKGTLKLTARDIFYTVAYEGLTTFPNATEYFKLTRDTRVVTLAFTYRFGKAYKAAKRSDGSAGDVMQRVGNGS